MNDKEMIQKTIVDCCHNAWKEYMDSIGHAYVQIEPTDEMKESILSGALFYIKGFREGRKPTPQEMHDEWRRYKARDGWTYGGLKDVKKKEHPCMLPYQDLPKEERQKDEVFAMAVENSIRHLMCNRHFSMSMIHRVLEGSDGS